MNPNNVEIIVLGETCVPGTPGLWTEPKGPIQFWSDCWTLFLSILRWPSILLLEKVYFYVMCQSTLPACMNVLHMYAWDSWKVRRGHQVPHRQSSRGLWAAGWVAGTELWSSAGAASAHSGWAVCPEPSVLFLTQGRLRIRQVQVYISSSRAKASLRKGRGLAMPERSMVVLKPWTRHFENHVLITL